MGPPVKRGRALPSWRRLLLDQVRARRAAAAPRPALQPNPSWLERGERAAFREYERRPGERGAPGRPEYRVVDLWDGREVDAGFTFDRTRADEMFEAALQQAYDAELWQREAGDWQLIKREAAE